MLRIIHLNNFERYKARLGKTYLNPVLDRLFPFHRGTRSRQVEELVKRGNSQRLVLRHHYSDHDSERGKEISTFRPATASVLPQLTPKFASTYTEHSKERAKPLRLVY